MNENSYVDSMNLSGSMTAKETKNLHHDHVKFKWSDEDDWKTIQ